MTNTDYFISWLPIIVAVISVIIAMLSHVRVNNRDSSKLLIDIAVLQVKMEHLAKKIDSFERQIDNLILEIKK